MKKEMTAFEQLDTVVRTSLRHLPVVIFTSILIALVLKARLVFSRNINWDEFNYLGFVHKYLNHELATQFQTFHVYFFTWLPTVSENEVNQIVAARIAIYFLALATCWLIYLIGRQYFDKVCALFAVLCYISFSFVVVHGTSFRPDPIVAFLCLVAIYFALRRHSILYLLASGAAVGTAMMFSLKAVVFLPIVAALILIRLIRAGTYGRIGIELAALGIALMATFSLLFVLHGSSIASPNIDSASFLETSAFKVFHIQTLFPARAYFFQSLLSDLVFWLTLCAGIAITLHASINRVSTASIRVPASLMVFLLPLVTLIFYRNAFPYYYLLIVPPAALVCGSAFRRILPHSRTTQNRGSPPIAWALVLSFLPSMFVNTAPNLRDQTNDQRRTIEIIHKMFPDPVAYIDRTSMIASYPKVGFFMSTWGMENYLQSDELVFREILDTYAPKFLIASTPVLDLSKTPAEIGAISPYRLHDEDFFTLKDNYVHEWGLIYVAGKTLEFESQGQSLDFEILIPGKYDVESSAPVTIDGIEHKPGSIIDLDTGSHTAFQETANRVILRWSERKYEPRDSGSARPLYTGLI